MNECYVGLDCGDRSVGWAVADADYHLLRAKGKDLWGVRLFDETKSAVRQTPTRRQSLTLS